MNEDRLGAKIVRGGLRPGSAARSAPRTRCASTSRRYEEAGVDQVIFCARSGKNRHEHIMESLELFGREVLPEFMDRDEKPQQEKARGSSR